MHSAVEKKLREFLDEDLGSGDITTDLLISEGEKKTAVLIAKQPGVIAGLEEARLLAEMEELKIKFLASDGSRVRANQVVAEINGDAGNILRVERVLLNLVSHMSGIATLTRKAVDEARKQSKTVRIAATRKTLPGLRFFEKKAVALGDGDPHRYDLSSMVLIKDNHITISGGIESIIRKAKNGVSFTQKIEVEVTNEKDAIAAARAGADIIMFDNMQPASIKKAIRALEREGLREGVLLEASGGITVERVGELASTGVDVLSMGILTHSAPSLNVAMKIAG